MNAGYGRFGGYGAFGAAKDPCASLTAGSTAWENCVDRQWAAETGLSVESVREAQGIKRSRRSGGGGGGNWMDFAMSGMGLGTEYFKHKSARDLAAAQGQKAEADLAGRRMMMYTVLGATGIIVVGGGLLMVLAQASK